MKQNLLIYNVLAIVAVLLLSACKKEFNTADYTIEYEYTFSADESWMNNVDTYIYYQDMEGKIRSELIDIESELTGQTNWKKGYRYAISEDDGALRRACKLNFVNKNSSTGNEIDLGKLHFEFVCKVVHTNGDVFTSDKYIFETGNTTIAKNELTQYLENKHFEFSSNWSNGKYFLIQKTEKVKLPDFKVVTFEDMDFEDYISNTSFCSGIMDFKNIPDEIYEGYYYGCFASKMHNQEDKTIENQYSSCGLYASSKNTFAEVYYLEYNDIKGHISFNDNKPRKILSMAINNSTYTEYILKNGNEYSKKFAAGDWFCATITGFNGDKETGSISAYLADFRDGKSFICSDWMNIDMTTLEEVTRIEIKMDSSDKGVAGINTPTYMCIDDIYYIEE